MARHVPVDWPTRKRKEYHVILAYYWIFGLVFGLMVYSYADISFSRMPGFSAGALSIVSLLGIIALPFLISLFTIVLGKPIWVICFCKAFSLSFTGLCVIEHFGSAGYVFRYFVLFSSCFAAPILYLFWLRSIQPGPAFFWETALFLALLLLTGSIDYCLVSPFWVSLVKK